ncbi:MAG: hypothetical protein LUH51_00300 [Firmicutes bacterium]|nr:hypothetical protein [Bacillota bacterium]
MLELLALLLGLASWCLPILCLLRRKHISHPKISALQSGSLVLCAIALYIPSLSQYLEVLEKDYSAMIDCATAFHLASAVLLAVTLALNLIVWGACRKQI